VEELVTLAEDVARNRYCHVKLCTLDPDEELEEVTLATSAIRKFVGDRPLGWRSPIYSVTERTSSMCSTRSRGPRPGFLHWAMHPKISGRPYPAAVLDRLLACVVAHQGVWIATANEVASLA
jgi:hypothetical protein